MEVYQEQSERVKELFLLQRVAQKINSILDLDILLEEIVTDVVETFGYSRSGILFKEGDELVIAAVRGWTSNYHMKGDRFKIGEYGMTGHVGKTGVTYYAPDVTVDPYYEVSEESTKSEVDIPLKIKGDLIGVFNIQHHEPDAFNRDRIQLLESLANHVATAIENARLFKKERAEKDRMLTELQEARNIQLNLFPKSSPFVPGFRITGVCKPCREVGGDWFDFIPFEDGRVGVILADVSGKGIGAALLMSSTRSILRIVADGGRSPMQTLTKVNEILLKDFPQAKFVTLIYGIIDPVEKTFLFSNAGHLYPVFHDSGSTRFLETTNGFPLGVADSSFPECRIKFNPGSRLILYTDGLTEAMNSPGEEYGAERLKNHFLNSSASIESIIDDVNNFSQCTAQCDDVTVVMIEMVNSALSSE